MDEHFLMNYKQRTHKNTDCEISKTEIG